MPSLARKPESNNPDALQRYAFSMRARIKRHQPMHILLVEDDESDVMLTECALDETFVPHALHCVHDGSEMLAYLRREEKFTDAPAPDLILLDLSLPQMDGFEALAELTREVTFKHIPIIILSGSQERIPMDYRLWLSDHMSKPCSPDKLLEAFGKLHSPKSS